MEILCNNLFYQDFLIKKMLSVMFLCNIDLILFNTNLFIDLLIWKRILTQQNIIS